MNCPEVMELMQRQLDNDLTDSEMEVLTNHTRQCPDCAAMLERLKLLSAELTSLPKVAPSYSLVDAIMPQLEQIELTGKQQEAAAVTQKVNEPEIHSVQARREKRKRRWPSMRIAGGVIAAGIVAGLFLVTYNGNDAPGVGNTFSADNSSEQSRTADEPAADQQLQLFVKEKKAAEPDVKMESLRIQDDPAGSSLNQSGGSEPAPDSRNTGGQAEEGAPSISTKEEPSSASALTGEGVPSFVPQADVPQAEMTNKSGVDVPTEGTTDGSADPEKELTDDSPDMGIAQEAAAPHSSPDGQFTAIVEDFVIKIYKASDQALVLESNRRNGSLLNLTWSEDSTKLYYEVHVDQGASEKFMLDLTTGEDKKAEQ